MSIIDLLFVFIFLLVILQIALVYFSVRNNWVRDNYLKLLDEDYEKYRPLPSYNYMLWRKFWIWDFKKFLKQGGKPPAIDPACLVHGKKRSDNDCIYCCICFESLTPEQCNINGYGMREDVCARCAKGKLEIMERQD